MKKNPAIKESINVFWSKNGLILKTDGSELNIKRLEMTKAATLIWVDVISNYQQTFGNENKHWN